MGGAAFASDGLMTPRMPATVYERVLQEIEARLEPYFAVATHTIEAPEKADYGDIDILAAPHPDTKPSTEQLALVLGAKTYYHGSVSNGVMHFALPWPKEAGQTHTEATDHNSKYVQVDLIICRSIEDLNWRLFAHGHGDLVNILSNMIRHKGLLITNQAFYLRIPDLETSNRKLARIVLSESPEETLRFLGLDPARSKTPFETKTQMMDYIATCRFFDPARLKEINTEKRMELIKATLKKFGKSQLETRPFFRYWYDQYLPAHKTDPPQPSAQMTRDEVREEAFIFFGGDTQTRYNTVKHDVGTSIARDKLWAGIRAHIIEKNPDMPVSELRDTMRALRQEITRPGSTAPAPAPAAAVPSTSHPDSSSLSDLQKAYLTDDYATVHDWATTNHAAALARYHAALEQKRTALLVIDDRKANKYSQSDLETYTAADDERIVRMKAAGKTWGDILTAIGKSSRSQLQAHWKNDLQGREE